MLRITEKYLQNIIYLVMLVFVLSGCSGSSSGSIDSSEAPPVQKLLTISPLTKTVGLGGTLSFDASGGSEPYSFDVYYGNGSITSVGVTGTYQAPLAEGAAVIRVQDQSGDTGYATVEIADSPVIQPSIKTLAVGNVFPFSVLSGKAPYVFSVVSGEGTINATTGEFVSGTSAGTVIIRVTDADSRTADATVTVSAALSFASNNIYVEKNATSTLSATGGVSPYSYFMASGAGSVNKTTGVYTAPSALGTSTVHVVDSLGNFDLAVMNITTALGISPSNALIAKNSNFTFSGVGGVPPYSYSILAGGTCIASTVVLGQYAAPTNTCSDTVRVTDALGNTSDASVSVTNSLSFSVSHLVLAVGNSYDVSTIVTGGVAPLTYTVPSSQGLFSGPIYTAPNTPGVYTITVYDSQSPANTVTTSVLVNSSLSLLPTSAVMASGSQKNFSASGGVPPYVYSVQSGGGSIIDGLYTAPNTSGSIVLLVTDARSNTATAAVTVQEALAIVPTTKTLSSGESFTFTASGGTLPYSFSVVSGSGSINSSSGVYTAPGSSGLATVRVEDASGNRKDALVTILNPLSIAPPTIALMKNGSITFTASGGAGPYTYSVVAGDGSVNATTGVYVAPSAAGSNTVRVTDSFGSIKDATVTIYEGLSISPFTKSLAVNQTFTFTATGGVPPYTYSLNSGVGSVTAGGGYSSSTSGAAVVRVTDSGGNTSDATVSVNSALAINPTSKTLSVNNSFTFSATGGVPPYAFLVLSGNGTVTTAGDYKAPSSSTSAVVRVTDSAGTTSDATVTVTDALTISPTAATVAAAGTQSYIAAGGVGLYVYTVVSGGGFFTSSTYTAPSVASGASVAIVVTDSLGNTANATVTVPPITVTIGSPNSSDFITDSNKAAFTVSGTCSESGRTVVVSASDGTNAAVTASPSCSSGTWTTNLNLTSLSDVAITITANHSNTNSVAATPASVTVTKDGGVPTITITAPSASSYVGNSITVTGSCSESGRAVNLSATGSITAITTCSSGTYSSTLVYPNSTTDGTITITATHSDSAANAATPATVNVTKDSVAPVISAFTITNSSPTSSTTFNLTSSITDASTITHYCILINSTTLASCTWTSGSLPSSVVINPATSGDKTLSAWVKDAGGNISARRDSNLVTLDLVVPTITISVPAASAYVNASNVSAYTVSGSCNKEGGGVNIKAGSTSVGTATCTSNAWSTSTADFSAIAEGSISLTAVLTDLASNTVTSSAVSITKDVTAPSSLAITNDGIWMNSTSTSPGISYTAATDATSGVLKHQIQIVLGSDTSTVLKNWADFNSTGSTVTSLSLTDGLLYKVQMKAIDNAGNTSTVVTSTDGWTVDTTVPTTPGSVNDGSTGNITSSPALGWNASTDSTSGINYYEVAIGTTAGGTDISTWTSVTNVTTTTVTSLNLSSGATYYASVRAVDNAGNTSLVGQGDGWTASNPADPYFNYVTLLLKGTGINSAQNNTFLDTSTNAFTVTRSGNPTQGAFSPYNPTGWSAYFDGTSSIQTSSAQSVYYDLIAANTTFTIEAWVLPNSFATGNPVVSCMEVVGAQYGGWDIQISTTGYLQLHGYFNGNNQPQTFITTTNPLTKGRWSHIAVVGNSGVVKLYVDGVDSGGGANINASWQTPIDDAYLTIGGDYWNKATSNISNVRILKGTALYTTNFTPSISPLLVVTNTQLLILQDNRLKDNSANAFTFSTTGTPKIQAVSPFAPAVSYTTTSHGGSGYFDGTGDYLTIPDSANLELGSSSFTIEMWANLTDFSTFPTLLSKGTNGSANQPYFLYIDNTGRPVFASIGIGLSITGTVTVTKNMWNHIAVTRSGSTWTVWVNGVSSGTASSASTAVDTSEITSVGATNTGSSAINGYLSDFRIVVGTAVYTAPFTPPTAPLTAITNTRLLLKFTNAGIYDAHASNIVETVGDAQVSTDPTKFSNSMHFDGTGDYVYLPQSSNLSFGSGPFTIEFWVRHSLLKTYSGLIGPAPGTSAVTGLNIYSYADGHLGATIGQSFEQIATAAGVVQSNTWNHIALVRVGDTYTLYVDGTSRGTYTTSGDRNLYGTSYAVIGSPHGTGDFNGYIEDFRVTKGIARYTSDFTPPTAAFQEQ